MNQISWKDADRAQVLQIARDLRSSYSTKTAIMNGNNVTYIKGKKVTLYLSEKHSMSQAQATDFGNALLREGLVMKAEVYDNKKQILRPTAQAPKEFDEKAFLVWTFEGSTGMRNLLLIAIVMAFFGLVLFPVWPQSAKVGVWYVSMTLLLVLLGFICIRLVLFLVLYAVGMDFWILPNFFADDLSIVESFRPLYSFSFSMEDVSRTWPYRVAVILAIASSVFWFMTQPTEFDEFVASQRAFVDELYEGTLLSDKSQKEKEQIDKVVPDLESLEAELEELERVSEEEAQLDQKLDEIMKKEELDQDQEEIADL